MGSIELDIKLSRGIWITGRLTDKMTGQPLSLASLYYSPFLSNQYAQQTPEFGGDRWVQAGSTEQHRYKSALDGTFRLVGLPGRAIVGAMVAGEYRTGVGADQIEGVDDKGHFATYLSPVEPGRSWPNVMREINPALDAETVTCDLQADPGIRVRFRFVDVRDPRRSRNCSEITSPCLLIPCGSV